MDESVGEIRLPIWGLNLLVVVLVVVILFLVFVRLL